MGDTTVGNLLRHFPWESPTGIGFDLKLVTYVCSTFLSLHAQSLSFLIKTLESKSIFETEVRHIWNVIVFCLCVSRMRTFLVTIWSLWTVSTLYAWNSLEDCDRMGWAFELNANRRLHQNASEPSQPGNDLTPKIYKKIRKKCSGFKYWSDHFFTGYKYFQLIPPCWILAGFPEENPGTHIGSSYQLSYAKASYLVWHGKVGSECDS